MQQVIKKFLIIVNVWGLMIVLLFFVPVAFAVEKTVSDHPAIEKTDGKEANAVHAAGKDKSAAPAVQNAESKPSQNKESVTKSSDLPLETKKAKSPYADAEITIRIIPSVKKTYGYDILIYGRPLIHQPNIPGLPGNEGFSTKQKAQTVAEFVVKKIRRNEMPPTVTIDDLNKMNVLK